MKLGKIKGDIPANVYIKLEFYNPTGSYKDRMALAMIEGAERDGLLRKGDTVIEYTGGSTGSSLAFVCTVKGYKIKIVTSDAFSEEKITRCGPLALADHSTQRRWQDHSRSDT